MSTHSAPTRFGFLLCPDFTLIALSSAIEPLRMANRISGRSLYEYSLFSFDGGDVRSSSGLDLTPVSKLTGREQLDALFLCAGTTLDSAWDQIVVSQLKPLIRRKVIIGGICTGSYLLARTGLLNGYRCTIHWENIFDMHDEFPELIVSSELFELDGKRYTCSGGTAPLDMMLTLVARDHGTELALSLIHI